MLREIEHLLPMNVPVSLRERERARERERERGREGSGTRKILSPKLSGGGPTAPQDPNLPLSQDILPGGNTWLG